jgi:hypothetical protein
LGLTRNPSFVETDETKRSSGNLPPLKTSEKDIKKIDAIRESEYSFEDEVSISKSFNGT